MLLGVDGFLVQLEIEILVQLVHARKTCREGGDFSFCMHSGLVVGVVERSHKHFRFAHSEQNTVNISRKLHLSAELRSSFNHLTLKHTHTRETLEYKDCQHTSSQRKQTLLRRQRSCANNHELNAADVFGREEETVTKWSFFTPLCQTAAFIEVNGAPALIQSSCLLLMFADVLANSPRDVPEERLHLARRRVTESHSQRFFPLIEIHIGFFFPFHCQVKPTRCGSLDMRCHDERNVNAFVAVSYVDVFRIHISEYTSQSFECAAIPVSATSQLLRMGIENDTLCLSFWRHEALNISQIRASNLGLYRKRLAEYSLRETLNYRDKSALIPNELLATNELVKDGGSRLPVLARHTLAFFSVLFFLESMSQCGGDVEDATGDDTKKKNKSASHSKKRWSFAHVSL
ncbi:uncharacterized protein V6R79_015845 [Siganus canaliculatus]